MEMETTVDVKPKKSRRGPNEPKYTDSHLKKARRIATLLAGYMRDNLSPAEHDELDEWVGASDKNMRLFEELTDERRVQLALELLNDNTKLVQKVKEVGHFRYGSSRTRIGKILKILFKLLMIALAIVGVLRIIFGI